MIAMRFRRGLRVCWLALALNVLAPVVAYAHIQHELGGGGAWCAADPAPDGHVHGHHDGDADPPAGSTSTHGRAPHCPYCPGFSAGAPLALSLPVAGAPAPGPARVGHVYLRTPAARASLRIAQPRAPPSAP